MNYSMITHVYLSFFYLILLCIKDINADFAKVKGGIGSCFTSPLFVFIYCNKELRYSSLISGITISFPSFLHFSIQTFPDSRFCRKVENSWLEMFISRALVSEHEYFPSFILT